MSLTSDDVLPLGTRDLYNVTSHFIDRNIKLGHKNEVAIYDDEGTTTYGELQKLINQVGNGLSHLGVQLENRVLLVCYDSVEFVASFFGAVKIGAIPIPTNTMLSPVDYLYCLNDCRAGVLIIESEIWSRICDLQSEMRYLKNVVIVSRNGENENQSGNGIFYFSDWLQTQSDDLSSALTYYDDAAFWLYTSGSTGRPKGAVHLQHDMEFTFRHYAQNILGITHKDITFSASKLFFAYGLGNGMYFPFGAGGASVLMRRKVTPESIFSYVNKFKPTIFFGVPSLYAAMLDQINRVDIKVDFSSVRFCVSAGEPLPPSIYSRFKDVFGIEILDGIGSTEALHIYISNRPGNAHVGSTGQPVPGYEVKIVDEDGKALSPNEPGELLLKGDSLAQGYWNLHRQTKAKFGGEWYHTGDRYYYDTEGFFWYCGRQDDMLKSGGIWVSPIEIENTLLEHESVLEAAVVGGRDENGIEKPVAFIVLKNQISENEIEIKLRNLVRERLAHYKCPKRFIFVENLPKTNTGKIQRFKLRSETFI